MAIHEKAREEYEYFLEEYLLPLLGMEHRKNDLKPAIGIKYPGSSVALEQGNIYFSTDTDTVFVLEAASLSDDNKKLAINIIQSFFVVSEFRLTSVDLITNHSYYSVIQKKANYKMSVQKGICNWIVGTKNDNVEKLFSLLEKWSVQTYEGRKVTFGFIVNPDAKSDFENDYGNWCKFLDDDFSAVLTDCIDSAIELDANCDFVRYISLTDNSLDENKNKYELSDILPLRFSEIIKKFVVNKSIGIFLLNNGDIIISKQGTIRFVKRNLKWLNFNYDSFRNSLSIFSENECVDEELIKNIFASILDVSFSHTGGIISVVTDINQLTKCAADGQPDLNSCDYLDNSISIEKIREDITRSMNNCGDSKTLEKEIAKRVLKRHVIQTLVGDKNFIQLDRKLRCELISMDGACILDTKGKVCAFGAIIKNNSGSSGGGRGAAAKKLSKYGFSIKISTDGYIELFINEEPKFTIK